MLSHNLPRRNERRPSDPDEAVRMRNNSIVNIACRKQQSRR